MLLSREVLTTDEQGEGNLGNVHFFIYNELVYNELILWFNLCVFSGYLVVKLCVVVKNWFGYVCVEGSMCLT